MQPSSLFIAALSASQTLASSLFDKRADSWGPSVGLGPAKAEIISATSTTYPGAMPQNQAGGLFLWVGMSNGTGDLVQSIVGSYVKGSSECSGANADTEW